MDASSDSPAGIQQRIREAGEHLKAVDELTKSFVGKPHPYSLLVQADPKRSRVLLRAVDVEPVPPELSILIGQFAYQMRAVLDNLVYALAEVNHAPAPLPRRIAETCMFPIRPSGPKFRNERWRLKGVGRSPAAAIERLQPYHRRKKPAAIALRQLDELRNIDQHRLLHPAAIHRDVSSYTLLSPRGDILAPGGWKAFNRPLKENALLARFDYVAGVPEPQVYMEEEVALDVTFERRSPGTSIRQRPVVKTLSAISAYVRGEVLEALLPFLGERTQGSS